MSLRSGTQKAKKFGTPTTPTSTTPKAPSPKVSKTIKTVTGATVTTGMAKPQSVATRKILTPTAAGAAAQQKFKDQLQTIAQIFKAPLHLFTSSRTEILKKAAGDARIEKQKQDFKDQLKEEREKLQNVELNASAQQIISVIQSGDVIVPDWFQNNIAWIQTGQITSKEFLNTYYHLSEQGIIHSKPSEEIIEEEIIEEPIIEEPLIELPALLSANIKISFTNPNIGGFSSSIPIDDIGKLQILSNTAPEWKYTLIGSSTNPPLTTLNELIITINDLLPNITITDNMVTQQVINFNIVDGRAIGSIRFVATNNFNPYYYGKNIVNVIQIKDPNGAKILDVVKENRLNFTETERDEVISYDEDMKGNTRATVESFVWSSATTPTAFSKMSSWDISEKEPPKPLTTGFMGAGVAGAIAGLILIGFIADHKRGK